MMTEIKTLSLKQEALERELQAHYIEGWRIEALTAHFSYQLYIVVLARDTATREEFEAHLHAMNSDQVNDAYRRERGIPPGDGFTPTIEVTLPREDMDWGETDG